MRVKERKPISIAKAIENVLEDVNLRTDITNKASIHITKPFFHISHQENDSNI